MFKAENILAGFLGRLLDYRFFADVQITRAFPRTVKPTVLKNTVIAVGIQEIHIDDASIGGDVKTGFFSVFADIFVPFSDESATPEKFVFRICRDTADFRIVSVRVSEIKTNSTAGCYVMRAVFTFHNEIVFGGNGDE